MVLYKQILFLLYLSMTTISELYDAFSQLRIREQIPVIIKRNEYPLMVKIIAQHDLGLLGTGQKITPSYGGKYYSTFKASLNPTPGYGTPDVRVTGSYNSELHITVNDPDYTVDSEVSYANSASLTQYGNNLNLPTDAHANEFWNENLAPDIIEYVKENTGL